MKSDPDVGWLRSYATARSRVRFVWGTTADALIRTDEDEPSFVRETLFPLVTRTALICMHRRFLQKMNDDELSLAVRAIAMGLCELHVEHEGLRWMVKGAQPSLSPSRRAGGPRRDEYQVAPGAVVSFSPAATFTSAFSKGSLTITGPGPVEPRDVANIIAAASPADSPFVEDLAWVGFLDEGPWKPSLEALDVLDMSNYYRHRYASNYAVRQLVQAWEDMGSSPWTSSAQGHRTMVAPVDWEAVRSLDVVLRRRKSVRTYARDTALTPAHLVTLLRRSGILRAGGGTVSPTPRASGDALTGTVRVWARRLAEGGTGLWSSSLGGDDLVWAKPLDVEADLLFQSAALAMQAETLPDVIVQTAVDLHELSHRYADNPGLAYALALKQGGVFMQALYMAGAALGVGVCGLGSLYEPPLNVDQVTVCDVALGVEDG